jgi:hypothetical protein
MRRLTRVRKHLDGTRFKFREHDAFVEVTCPWGNRIQCYEPRSVSAGSPSAFRMWSSKCHPGPADGIARFYRRIIATPAAVAEDEDGRHARVSAGDAQNLVFRDKDRDPPPYDGHHIQVYVDDFSGPYRRLLERGLITEESDQHQYRFKDIVDPDEGKALFTIEPEVRGMKHPLFFRPLINRNPSQSNVDYAPDCDARDRGMTRDEGNNQGES